MAGRFIPREIMKNIIVFVATDIKRLEMYNRRKQSDNNTYAS